MTRAKQWLRWPIGCGRAAALATVLAVAGVAGCTKSNEQVAAAALADPGVQALLAKIPADTPYAFISFGGSARPMVEKIYKSMGPAMERIGPMIDQMPMDQEWSPLAKAIFAEFRAVMKDGGLDRTGIDIDGRAALYGIGGLPAARWTLKDPQALRDLLGRVQQAGNVTIPVCKLGDAEYWCGGNDDIKFAAAIVSDELVMGVAPPAMADKVFELLFGKTAPERSLADSPKLRDLLTSWQLGKHNVGYVDARVIAEALLGEGDPLNKEVLAALAPKMAEKWPQLTQVCKDEFRGLAAIAPMLVFGTETMSAEGFEAVFGVELRSDLAQDFKALRASVPGLTKELRNEAVFAMGGGFDVGKAIEWALRKGQEVTKSPYQCPELAELNDFAAKIGQETSAIPKWVPGLRGGSLVLTDIKMSGFLPSSITAHAVLAAADPRAVYEAIKAETSAIAAYEFSDDGAVKTLPDGTVPFVNGIAYGAKAGTGIVVAIGPGSESTVGKLLSAPEVKDPPLGLFAYDMAKIMGQLEPVMGMAGQPELAGIFDVYKVFGPSGYEMYAEDRGLVLKAGMTLH
ncbi:hypothetical protein SAMN02745121_05157 [Nannocystis exedens]|uniref:DUF3352 domain-containing protein n=1 Tax=Nannocystis exedens TaxID=54 RepID=A0A1I2CI64_9BACT|nr:hypothetical protein [Nannocystis exedens]PCC68275.1 hypothetical protein NAEX_01285 [Nannocystis exedens]SFE68011.1 hypothetical protein SAMN02745121_05157 [Nannocystis exedens]